MTMKKKRWTTNIASSMPTKTNGITSYTQEVSRFPSPIDELVLIPDLMKSQPASPAIRRAIIMN